jgi:hypothetical protein
MDKSWQVSGTYFEACTCAVACPCVFHSNPTAGDCTALVGWHIDHGRHGDIRLDGLNVALLVYTPGNMVQTKWKVALYLDKRASSEQQEALQAIYSGQAGGHIATLAPLIGEVLGVRTVPIEYSANGRERHLTIPGTAQADISAIEGQGGAPVTVENHPVAVVPGQPAVVASSRNLSIHDYGFALDISGKNGFYSPFAYSA